MSKKVLQSKSYHSIMSFFRPLASYYRRNVLFSSMIGHGYHPPSNLRIASFTCRNLHSRLELNNSNNSIKPSLYPQSYFYSWAKWILGSILATALPFWNRSWKKLLRLEDEVEIVAEAVESAAEIVEKVANVAEKVSSDIAEQMPKNGKLKEAVLFVENVAEEVAEAAQHTQEIIHKMEELKEEIEGLKKKDTDTEESHSKQKNK
ncbi:uncharacterized protein LOC110026040 [Phalaenopsis equestris]|uniref:uncharacterized protein LOC110026040 n=1 Tax=Phalaenopsis equestris TaxID=78828 RepID=UPI0009E358F8|nr:uncharacterized protein LOC110026040 [Phalaenopsis equestris]